VEKLKAIDEAATAENAYQQARQEAQAGKTPGMVEMQINQDWQILALRQNLMNLKVHLASLPEGEENAKALLQLKTSIEATQRQLDERTAERRASLTDAHLSSLNAQWQSKRASVERTSQRVAELQTELADLGDRLAEYQTRRDEEAAYRELSRRYTEQLDQLNVTRQRVDMSQISLAARAGQKP
jgi:uncharacterized protein YaaR (DUF327 family)